jgi:D-alanyl-D-alanine carboxypeptidase
MKYKKIIEGVLLSFVPLFSFVFFVYGSQLYFTSGENIKTENFLASVADVPAPYLIEDNKEGNTQNTTELEDQKVIDAASAISILIDSNREETEIFGKNEDSKLPIASLTKLMTAIVSLDNYDLSQKIILSEIADSQLPMQTDLKLGDTFSIEQYLRIMLIGSSNKAAYALAEQLGDEQFILLMNQKAKDVGLINTFFSDPTGLSQNNISTVEDLFVLAKYITYNYPVIGKITTTQNYELENFGKIANTNQLLSEFPNVILGKTGFTNYANGCLLLVLKNENNNYIINVVLGANDRFSEMKKIINLKF